MKQALSLSSPRVRFNWGFHDATADRTHARKRDRRTIRQGDLFCLPLWDKAYCEGYAAGWECDLSAGRPESSDAAWRENQSAKVTAREGRQALRDARPSLFASRC